MKLGSSAVALAVGGGFGAATSLINDVSSPYGSIGSRLVGTGWAWATEVASLLVDQGWAWAGLAVAMGWLAGAGARGAVAGVLALLAATTSYYGTDSVLREETFAMYWGEMLQWWWPASVVLGPPLGAAGASIGRPGVIGLLAGLTVPVGATIQMVLLFPSDPLLATPAEDWARAITLVAAAVGAGVVVARFMTRSRPSSRARSGRR